MRSPAIALFAWATTTKERRLRDPLQVIRYDASHAGAMLLYSDRVIEAWNARDEQYGSERLLRLLLETERPRAERLVERVAEDGRRFCLPGDPADDVTLLVVERFAGRPGESTETT